MLTFIFGTYRIQKPETTDGFRALLRHWQSVTAIALSEDDSRGFSASKDGTIRHWDVDSGKSERYIWPNKETLNSHGAKNPQNPSIQSSKHVLSLAVSSDGRYLATGGLDRHVHLWDTRTREHIQVFFSLFPTYLLEVLFFSYILNKRLNEMYLLSGSECIAYYLLQLL